MKIKTLLALSIFTLFLFSISTFGQQTNKQNFAITPNSVGDIRLGMTLSEAIEMMSSADFRHYECECAGDFDSIGVRRNGKLILTIGLDANGKIFRITSRDSRFRLSNEIGSGTTISAAERFYGRVKDIAITYDIETAEFANHPKGIEFKVYGKNGEAGDYRNWKGTDPREKHSATYTSGAYISNISVSYSSNDEVESGKNLITPTSVGDIRLGMTVTEARKVFPGTFFEQYDYSEEGVQIEIKRGEKILMSLSTDQENKTGDRNGRVPIVESAKIERIMFSDTRYKTADGIRVGSTVSATEKAFGKVLKIDFWGLDGSEHVTFANAPKAYGITIAAKPGSGDEARGGIYAEGKVSTTSYSPGAVIDSLVVSNYR